MRPLHQSTPVLVCSTIALVLLTAIGFIPLFGGPGYEAALAAGLVLPSLAALASCFGTSHREATPSAAFVRSTETALVLSATGFLVMLLHGARAGFCDPGSGLVLYGLGPAMGTLMGGIWGFVVGQLMLLVGGNRLRVALSLILSLLAPALCVIVSLIRFYTSPMVFAYDPLFGYFSGTLYDTVVTDSLSTLLIYRAGSMATVFAVGSTAFCLERPKKGWLALSPNRHPGVMWFAAAAAVASLLVTIEGSRLGHWQTAKSIEQALGAKVVNERCEVIYPRFVDDATARLILHDCAMQSRQVIAFLGIERAPRVRVYMFANQQQKRALTGAARASVAKPWRDEVYVQLDDYPHPVLGHELAHVLAGKFARGPFQVAGGLGGLWPDPGLIEGIAVAASPEDDLLTPQQWSAAMLSLDLLPDLSDVFALGFLGQNSSKAYTVAGAFVQWVADRYGMAAVRRWYGGETIEAVTGQPFGSLETAWRTDLQAIRVPEPSLTYAKARFDRPGLFLRRCPHAVDTFNADGQTLASQGDCAGATLLFERAAVLDPFHPQSRLNLAECGVRVSGLAAGKEQWQALATDANMPDTTRFRAREALADLHLSAGDLKEADEIYLQLLEKVANESHLRTIDIKLRAARNPFEARAVCALLLGDPGRAPDQRLAFALLGKWMTDVPSDGLPAYLIGKNLMASGAWEAAGEFLDWALERELAEPRVMREALRSRIIVACAQRQEDIARRAFARWKAQPGLQDARWKVLRRRLGSCIGK